MCSQKALVVGCGSSEELLMDLTFNSNNLPNNVNSAAGITVDMSHGQYLRITTYISIGFGNTKCAKVQSMSDDTDIILIHEHWLLKSQFPKITKGIKGSQGQLFLVLMQQLGFYQAGRLEVLLSSHEKH